MKQHSLLFFICSMAIVSVVAMEDSKNNENGTPVQSTIVPLTTKMRSLSLPSVISTELSPTMSPKERRAQWPLKHSHKTPICKTRSVSDQTVSLIVYRLSERFAKDLPPAYEIAPKNSPKTPTKKTSDQQK